MTTPAKYRVMRPESAAKDAPYTTYGRVFHTWDAAVNWAARVVGAIIDFQTGAVIGDMRDLKKEKSRG